MAGNLASRERADSSVAALQQALSLQRQGRFPEAERICVRILNENHEHFDALHLLAVILHQSSRHTEALDVMSRALAVDEQSAAAFYNRGRILGKLKRHQEALASFDRAVTLKPDYPEALFYCGYSLQELGRFEEAIVIYDRVLDLRQDSIEAIYGRAGCLFDVDRYDEALASYERVLAKLPKFVEGHVKRGDVLCEMNRFDEAIASYEFALSLQPSCVEAFVNRGLARQETRHRNFTLVSVAVSDEVRESYAGFYVNLDRSPGRRKQIESEIARHADGRVYQRFSAVDGNVVSLPSLKLAPGEFGCLLSHLRLLEQISGCDDHIHVVEDDTVFSRFTAKAVASIVRSDMFDHFDLVFTESFVEATRRAYKKYKLLYDKAVERDADGRVVRMHPTIVNYVAGTTSFVVNYRSIPTLVDVLRRSLEGDAVVPIDIAIRNAVCEGKLRVGCLFPFVTACRIDGLATSTIGRQENDQLSRFLLQLGRNSFFVDSDHKALSELASKLVGSPDHDSQPAPIPNQDSHQDLLEIILTFCASERYVQH